MKRSLLQDVLSTTGIFLCASFFVQFSYVEPLQDISYREVRTPTISLNVSSPASIASDHLAEVQSSQEDQPVVPAFDNVPLGVPALADPILYSVEFRELKADTIYANQVVQLDEDSFVAEEVRELADAEIGLRESDHDTVDSVWVANLNRDLKRRLLEAERRHGVLSEDWTVPSFDGLIEERIDLTQRPRDDYRVIPTQHGEPIVVKMPDAQPYEVAKNTQVDRSDSREFVKKEERLNTQNSDTKDTIQVLPQAWYDGEESQDVSMIWPFMQDKSQTPQINYTQGLSSAVVVTRQPRHWPTVGIARSTESLPLKLFSEEMIESLIALSIPDFDPRNESAKKFSIIFGEIKTSNGDPSDVEVRIVNAPNAMPVYFNEVFMPDENLQGTSKNGVFAFVGEGEGPYYVEAESRKIGLGSQLVVARTGHVSYLEIRESDLYKAKFFIDVPQLDASDKVDANYRVENLSLEESAQFEINQTELQLDLPTQSNFNYVNFRRGESEFIIQAMLNSFQSLMRVPLLADDDLQSLGQSLERGALVLYYEGDENFDLVFDLEGQRIEVDPLVYSVDEGIYLAIPNLEPGFVEYAFYPEGSEKVSTGIAIIEEGVISTQSIYVND